MCVLFLARNVMVLQMGSVLVMISLMCGVRRSLSVIVIPRYLIDLDSGTRVLSMMIGLASITCLRFLVFLMSIVCVLSALIVILHVRVQFRYVSSCLFMVLQALATCGLITHMQVSSANCARPTVSLSGCGMS